MTFEPCDLESVFHGLLLCDGRGDHNKMMVNDVLNFFPFFFFLFLPLIEFIDNLSYDLCYLYNLAQNIRTSRKVIP